MGASSTKEQAVTKAIENQDVTELRTILRDLTPEQIRALGKSFATVDENDCTILHLATWQDNQEILAPLLDYADDLEVRDGVGWTPLMTAVNRGSKQNVNMLLARGAKVDCDWAGGMSLIADAMNFADTELVLLLIDHGARVIPTPGMLANGQDQNAFYLLHFAVDDKLYDIAKVLIEKGRIPVNALDQSGWSALHLAAGHNNLDMLALLVSNNADVNIRDSQGNTPLAWAKEMGASEAAEELTKHGAVTDKEWHGEKVPLKTAEQRQEEWAGNNYDPDAENPAEVDGTRFEIEVEDSQTKRQSPLMNRDASNYDALQRQRSTPNAVF